MALAGADILGIVAGVFQIADVGARLSVRLSSFARKVKNADLAIRDVSQDIALTCNVLRELGGELQKDEEARLCSNQAITTTQSVIQECNKIFTEIENALTKSAPPDANSFQRWAQKIRYPFVEPHIATLRGSLERLKLTLLLMLNVIMYAGQIRVKASSSQDIQSQRELIRSLGEEVKANKEGMDRISRRIADSTFQGFTASAFERQDNLGSTIQASDANKASPAIADVSSNTGSSSYSADAQKLAQDEVSHYCSLIRALFVEVNAIKYQISLNTRTRICDGMIEVHNDQLRYYAKICGYTTWSPAWKLLDELYQRSEANAALRPSYAVSNSTLRMPPDCTTDRTEPIRYYAMSSQRDDRCLDKAHKALPARKRDTLSREEVAHLAQNLDQERDQFIARSSNRSTDGFSPKTQGPAPTSSASASISYNSPATPQTDEFFCIDKERNIEELSGQQPSPVPDQELSSKYQRIGGSPQKLDGYQAHGFTAFCFESSLGSSENQECEVYGKAARPAPKSDVADCTPTWSLDDKTNRAEVSVDHIVEALTLLSRAELNWQGL